MIITGSAMSYPREVRFLKGALSLKDYPSEVLPEVAFVGRSNVGKSSLINALVRRKGLAPISRTPGKTQIISFYQVENRFMLVDLPGYGYAKVPAQVRRRWRPMVEEYLSSREALCLVVLLLDLRRTPSDQDLQLKHWLDYHMIPMGVVLTKADKIPKGKRLPQIRKISQAFGISQDALTTFSILTREGRRELWRIILRAVDTHERKPV